MRELDIQLGRHKEHQAFHAGRIRTLTRLRDATNDADEWQELNTQFQSATALELAHAADLDRTLRKIRELENA